MANLPTRILRLLVSRGHAMLSCEIERCIGHKRPGAVGAAVDSLKLARCVSWTTQGWLATDTGRNYVRVNARLSFERGAA